MNQTNIPRSKISIDRTMLLRTVWGFFFAFGIKERIAREKASQGLDHRIINKIVCSLPEV